MRLYSVLVVDDESYVVGSLTALLQCQRQWNLEVYSAYNGQQAMKMLSSMQIDILITDIRMPGMNGLELAKHAHVCWPECKVMMLTAYDEFSYAYEAIHLGVDVFLLKTESDQKILEAIGKMIDELNTGALKELVFPENITDYCQENAKMLSNLLLVPRNQGETWKLLRDLGAESGEIWLVAAECPETEKYPQLEWLIREQVSGRANTMASCLLEGRLLMLMRAGSSISSLLGALDLTQLHFTQAFHLNCAVVVNRFTENACNLFEGALRIREYFEAEQNQTGDFICVLPDPAAESHGDGTAVTQLQEYIKLHLKADLSLNTLASIAGYSPAYLSRLFFDKTGMYISDYISDVKIAHLKKLAVNTDLSMNEIAGQLGFSSRSYFNRFVKKKLGCTPGQLRDGKAGSIP